MTSAKWMKLNENYSDAQHYISDLKERIAELEAENERLRAENERLRAERWQPDTFDKVRAWIHESTDEEARND